MLVQGVNWCNFLGVLFNDIIKSLQNMLFFCPGYPNLEMYMKRKESPINVAQLNTPLHHTTYGEGAWENIGWRWVTACLVMPLSIEGKLTTRLAQQQGRSPGGVLLCSSEWEPIIDAVETRVHRCRSVVFLQNRERTDSTSYIGCHIPVMYIMTRTPHLDGFLSQPHTLSLKKETSAPHKQGAFP